MPIVLELRLQPPDPGVKLMKIQPRWTLIIAAILIAVAGTYSLLSARSSPNEGKDNLQAAAVPAPGLVTMIDLGASECIPCKMMAPILEELKEEYQGKADIIFIDVWQKPDQAKKYGIRAIPTQIFFDADGREVQRHVGFLDKKQIIKILSELGVS